MILKEKHAKTQADIHRIISLRWSTRAFDLHKPISKEIILSLCEAARWAPSCFGDEPWRFIVWNRNSNSEQFIRAFNCLDPWNQKWVKTAPLLFAVLADSKFRKGNPNRWGQYDTGAASENLCLQAVASGLAAHQMGGFDQEKLIETFNIPEQFIPMAMIAVGYQADPDVLEDEHRSLEFNERKRKPLGEGFFDSTWGEPIV